MGQRQRMVNETKDKKLSILIVLTTITGCSVLLLVLLLPILFITGKFETFGNYGGFIGGLIGSGLSFVTVILVYRTYKLQEEELRETRNQLKKQQFETVFFNMLEMIHTMGKEFQNVEDKNFFIYFMDSLKLKYQPVSSTSLLLDHEFNKIIQTLDERLKLGLFKEGSKHRNINTDLIPNGREVFQEWRKKNIQNEQEYVGELYLTLFYLHNSELSHFFRYIHNTIIYIIEERKIHGDESKYINMVQSQLTNYQLTAMFYNCLSTVSLTRESEPKIKNLFDQYEMFHNLPIQLLIRPNHQDFYPSTNFKQKHSEYKWSEEDYPGK